MDRERVLHAVKSVMVAEAIFAEGADGRRPYDEAFAERVAGKVTAVLCPRVVGDAVSATVTLPRQQYEDALRRLAELTDEEELEPLRKALEQASFDESVEDQTYWVELAVRGLEGRCRRGPFLWNEAQSDYTRALAIDPTATVIPVKP